MDSYWIMGSTLNVGNGSALTTLYAPSFIDTDSVVGTLFPNLRNMSFQVVTEPTLPANLIEFHASSPIMSNYDADYTMYPELKVLSYFQNALSYGQNSTGFFPPSLKSLSIAFVGQLWYNISQANNGLDSLLIFSSGGDNFIVDIPSSVTHLDVNEYTHFALIDPASRRPLVREDLSTEASDLIVSTFQNLKSVTLRMGPSNDDLSKFLMSSASSVTDIALHYWTSEEISDLLCNYTSASLVTSLQLLDIQSSELPSCLERFTNLRTLVMEVNGDNGEGEGEDAAQPFPATELFSMPLLENLVFKSSSQVPFNGTLPTALFSSIWRNMKNLTLSLREMSGTIPWIGMNNLEYLDLSRNMFSVWPPFEYGSTKPIPKLKFVKLMANQLTTIPDDASLQRLTGLSYFDIGGNTFLGGPIPNVFGPQSSIEVFYADHTRLTGRIPTLYAPRLRLFDVSNSDFCFEMPEFNRSLTNGLRNTIFFAASDNFLNGTWPTSWISQPFRELLVDRNSMSGTIPSQLFSYSGIVYVSADLSSNRFASSALNLSTFPGDISLRGLLNTNFCMVNPQPSDEHYCNFDIPSICDCVDFWLPCLHTDVSECGEGMPPSRGKRETFTSSLTSHTKSSTKPSSFRPRSFSSSALESRRDSKIAFTCAQPAPREGRPAPPSGSNCRLPRPSDDFFCTAGQWVAYNDIAKSSALSLPPSSNTVISGSLTTTAIVFGNTNTTLSVGGCIYNLTQVSVNFDQTAFKQLQTTKGKTLSVPLIHQGCSSNDGTDLSTIAVSLNNNADTGCRKVSVRNSKTSSNTLIAAFTLDSSSCGRAWWIAVVTVGAIVIVAVVVIIIAVMSVPSFKAAVMPYKGSNAI